MWAKPYEALEIQRRQELIINYSRMLHGSCQTQWLEIEHGRRIYISDIAKCYKQGFLLFFFQRATLQHTTELDQAASVGLTV